MEQLIRIIEKDGNQVVSARELHAFLVKDAKGGQAGEQFNHWIERKLEYGYVLNEQYSILEYDYLGNLIPVDKNSQSENHKVRVHKRDYVLTLDTAKEMAMTQNNDKGKEARRYFLECEKLAKQKLVPSYQIEDPIARAKKWIEEQQKTLLLEEENKKLQFRSDFVDVVFESDGLFSMEEVAKILKLSFGRNTMLKKLREQKVFLESNTPKQSLINSKYFKVSEQIIDSGNFKKLVSTTYATSKGVGYLHKLFKNLN